MDFCEGAFEDHYVKPRRMEHGNQWNILGFLELAVFESEVPHAGVVLNHL
jgi:hypothetical protein